ncbi:hypothetical protein [Secundilactobacillus kimchicus]|uniref:hypothetical protein n=1 Tax=Secundilactobacillus kimchicus TaxID=528209 RepID=UPI0024A8952D|nr:hypothetical protein [Secundilactobacillus kimchicus]
MTRAEKIHYIVMNSNHSDKEIELIASRHDDDFLNQMMEVTDKSVEQQLDEQLV